MKKARTEIFEPEVYIHFSIVKLHIINKGALCSICRMRAWEGMPRLVGCPGSNQAPPLLSAETTLNTHTTFINHQSRDHNKKKKYLLFFETIRHCCFIPSCL